MSTSSQFRNTSLFPGEVHLWIPSKGSNGSSRLLAGGRELLSPDEIHRMSRLRNQRAADRFVLGRALTRRVLSLYLDTDPADLAFRIGINGKPELADGSTSSLCFNLSHASSQMVLAVARASSVGIDIERTDRAPAAYRIAQRFFSEGEIDELKRLGATAPAHALRLWSIKESIIKALGDTVWDGLAKVSVRIENGRILLRTPPNGDVSTWRLAGGNFGGDCFLAIATMCVEGFGERIFEFKTYQMGDGISELSEFEPDIRSDPFP